MHRRRKGAKINILNIVTYLQDKTSAVKNLLAIVDIVLDDEIFEDVLAIVKNSLSRVFLSALQVIRYIIIFS